MKIKNKKIHRFYILNHLFTGKSRKKGKKDFNNKNSKGIEKDIKEINISREWFKWNFNSCRYDCFFLLYYFIFKSILENKNLLN